MRRYYLLVTITFFCITSYANICTKLTGKWTGDWQDEKNHIFTAQLDLIFQDKLQGEFRLVNGDMGEVNGKCYALSDKEAYIILDKSKPLNNLCRGTLIQENKKFFIHF